MARVQKIALLVAVVCLIAAQSWAFGDGPNQEGHDHHGSNCPKKTEGALGRQRRDADGSNPLDQVQAGWKSATDFLGTQAKSAQEAAQKSWDSLSQRPKREDPIKELKDAIEGNKNTNPLDQVQAGWKSATDFLEAQAKSAQETVQKSWGALTRPKRQSNSNPLEGLQAGIQSLSGLFKPKDQGPPKSIDQTLPEAINREANAGGLPFSPAQLMGSINNLVRSSQDGGQRVVEGSQQAATQAQSGITAAFHEIGQGLKRIAEKNPSLLPDVKELYSNVASKLTPSNKQVPQGGLIPSSIGDQPIDNLAKVQAPGFQPTA